MGVFALYYTITSAQALLVFTAFFSLLGIVLIALGFVLLIAKTE
jgi:hypothetical protein